MSLLYQFCLCLAVVIIKPSERILVYPANNPYELVVVVKGKIRVKD